MRAAFIKSFGAPLDVVEVGEQPEPLVGPDVVVVDVAATSVNPVDWKVIAGYLQGAFPHHLPLIVGWDVAGTVSAVGPAVTTVAVGDRVAAYDREDEVEFGTFAERVSVPERAIAKVPDSLPLDIAAAVPLAGLTAEQLLDAAAVKAGDLVLVHAASGGVGSFAVQLAALRGAEVIGTASPANHDALRRLGATPVAYGENLVTDVLGVAAGGVDVIIDLAGAEALAATPQLLKRGGRVASIVDAQGVKTIAAQHGFEGHYVFVRPDAAMLARLLGLVAAGKLVVDIAGRYSLDQAAQALEANRQGHTRGKIVVTVA